jgi:hypothetical protein
MVAAITGTPAVDSAVGELLVTCNGACSTLKECGGGVIQPPVTPPVIPVVAFALQCPGLPSQIVAGDSLVLVFPVAATGNVAATSLTFINELSAGLEFVNALLDYGKPTWTLLVVVLTTTLAACPESSVALGICDVWRQELLCQGFVQLAATTTCIDAGCKGQPCSCSA